jgi:hypothetical protein
MPLIPFINKPKPELVLSPPKLSDVFKEEMCRETGKERKVHSNRH